MYGSLLCGVPVGATVLLPWAFMALRTDPATVPPSIAKMLHRKRVYGAVKTAVTRGVLRRPKTCSVCGGEHPKIQAHHEDYEKPLDVQWLCEPCHVWYHAYLRWLWLD